MEKSRAEKNQCGMVENIDQYFLLTKAALVGIIDHCWFIEKNARVDIIDQYFFDQSCFQPMISQIGW